MNHPHCANNSIAPRIALLVAASTLCLSVALLTGCNSDKPIGQQIAETANKIPGISVTYEDNSASNISDYSPAKPGIKIRAKGKGEVKEYSFAKAKKFFEQSESSNQISKKFPENTPICVVGYVQEVIPYKGETGNVASGWNFEDHTSNMFPGKMFVVGPSKKKSAKAGDVRILVRVFSVENAPGYEIEGFNDIKKGDAVRIVGTVHSTTCEKHQGTIVDTVGQKWNEAKKKSVGGKKYTRPSNVIEMNPGGKDSIVLEKYDFKAAKK